jgi:nitrogen fixation-related uncharacterized protein
MLYFLPWILLMSVSVAASLALLFWAMRSGQFSEQERARYLPLRDSGGPLSPGGSRRIIWEVYALLAVAGGVGLVLAATLINVAFRQNGG